MELINVTENAVLKINEIMKDEPSASYLRIFVQGGGCSGFQYGFTFDENKNEDDFEIPAGESVLLVDSMSSQYLQGAVVDYTESLQGSQFSIKNPSATSTCGCGSSFAV
jgi:iron-sulfur cluster insertion protein